MSIGRLTMKVGLFFLVAGLCWPAGAQPAGPKKILVLTPESRLLSQARLKRLGVQLSGLVRRYRDVRLLKGPGLGLRLLRIRARCKHSRPSCLAAMGRLARADLVLYTSINPLPGRYLVHMKLVAVAGRKLLDASRQPCRRSLEEVRNAMWKGWVAIHGPLLRSQMKVSANVTGAVVLLDGRVIGRTPLVLTRELSRGQHTVEVRHPGWASVRKVIRVKGGEGITVNVEMAKLVAVERPPVAHIPQAVRGTKLAGGKEEKALPPAGHRPPLPASIGKNSASQAASGAVARVAPAQKSARLPSLVQRRPTAASAAAGEAPAQQVVKPPVDKVGLVGAAAKPLGESSVPVPPERPGSRWYTSWWFWSIVGAAVAAGTTTGIVLGLGGGESIPAGKGRVTLTF